MAQFIKYVLDGEEIIYKWLESDIYYNYDNVDVHNILKNVIDDAQLEGSGFIFNEIVNAKIEVYKIKIFKHLLIYLFLKNTQKVHLY